MGFQSLTPTMMVFLTWLLVAMPAFAEAPPWIDTDPAPQPRKRSRKAVEEPKGEEYLDVIPPGEDVYLDTKEVTEAYEEQQQEIVPDIDDVQEVKKKKKKKRKKKKLRKKRRKKKKRTQRTTRERYERPAPRKSRKPFRFVTTTDLSFLVQTPLIEEDLYDQRFSTFGLSVLYSLPVFPLTKNIHVHGEVGISAMYSKLTVPQPLTEFSHWHFAIPARLRALFPLGSDKLSGEVFAGIFLQLIEYDTRDTMDGGFHFVSGISNFLKPDFGLGLIYQISNSMSFRLTAGYISLAGGIAITL